MRKKALAMLLSLGIIVGNLSGSDVDQSQKGSGILQGYAVASAATGTSVTSGSGLTEVKAPETPTVTQIEGGSKRVKLYWNKVSSADGYYIYYSKTKSGTYTRLKTITSKETVRYVKKSLAQNTTYYFKVSAYCLNGTKKVESALSAAVSAKTAAVAATSKAGKKYSTKAKFKKSPAYKKYAFLKNANYTRTFAIPGMKTTNVAGFANTKMVAQGACLAGAYLLVSAYDKSGTDESVIYVLSKSSKSYITTIVMPNKTKLNAMAYDGTNVWVTQGKKVSCFPYATVVKAVLDGSSFTELAGFSATYPILTTGSCMTYYNGVLWVGAYNAISTTNAYGYVLTGTGGKTVLEQKYYMTIPNRTRAIAFDADGYLYITRSSKTNNKVSGYMSQLRVFRPFLTQPTAKGAIKKGVLVKKTALPPMAMGCAVHGAFLYTVFAGCKYAKCTYVVDRVVAAKLTKLR